MDNVIHKGLAEGRWQKFDLCFQLANIGSEVSRTLNAIKKNNSLSAEKAFERALDLIDLTIEAKPRYSALKEICRFREIFCKAYIEKDINELEYLDNYTMQFAIAWQLKKS